VPWGQEADRRDEPDCRNGAQRTARQQIVIDTALGGGLSGMALIARAAPDATPLVRQHRTDFSYSVIPNVSYDLNKDFQR